MGCMNGRCSDDASDDIDRDQLIHQPQPGSINSSVTEYRVFPPSPCVGTDGRSMEDSGNTFPEGFNQSVGGTLRWEMHQDHMITSTQQETESSSRTASGNQYALKYDNHHQGHLPNGVTPNDRLTQPPVTASDIRTARGKEIFVNLKKSYEWKDQFDHPSQDFLALMDRLYMECQLHLTALSSRSNVEHKREADMIVQEMITVRNHWGAGLLPNSICNAFVRERIPMTLGTNARQFRIDCAQFFEPVPFYGTQQQAVNPGELMKLYRFSVYDLSRNEVVLRYYLERSNVTQLYHVLCFTCESYRGQVHPYGTEQPSYWDIRHKMLEDVCSRLMSALSPSTHPPPQPHVATRYPPAQGKGSVIIQVPTRNGLELKGEEKFVLQ